MTHRIRHDHGAPSRPADGLHACQDCGPRLTHGSARVAKPSESREYRARGMWIAPRRENEVTTLKVSLLAGLLLATFAMAGAQTGSAAADGNDLSARLSGPTTVGAHQSITLDATASTGVGLRFGWNMGDGTFALNGGVMTYTYSTPGTYTVTLDVTDGMGRDSFATMTIIVTEVVEVSEFRESLSNVVSTVEGEPAAAVTPSRFER